MNQHLYRLCIGPECQRSRIEKMQLLCSMQGEFTLFFVFWFTYFFCLLPYDVCFICFICFLMIKCDFFPTFFI